MGNNITVQVRSFYEDPPLHGEKMLVFNSSRSLSLMPMKSSDPRLGVMLVTHRDNPLPQLPSPHVDVSFERLSIVPDDVIPMLV